ncbi:hypothetical protein DEU56DRAFT_762203 [Suillus clintonianus]|uniref:uncharacterized protein n=1 Tax=Suillus clintonianus TaxID=1904413 RepID=UPI001B87A1F2|nr:uncharacterized protein DEU56DRAFT_762203 [Suillus clintonianus]KAG2111433.1 hypothetical protein DEU56DRAFT_762203 [Suillus clintonianus]
MTTSVDWAANSSNLAFRAAADKVDYILGQALQLDPADPRHIALGTELASTLSFTFGSFAYGATSVSPMVLSAAAEIHEHLDASRCKIATAPVWSNIRPDDPRSRSSPLYPCIHGYGNPPPSTNAPVSGPLNPPAPALPPRAGPSNRLPPTIPPVAGLSGSNAALAQDAAALAGKGKGKAREDPVAESTEERGRGMERGNQSRAPKAKRQRATSKAMITSEDDRELDEADIPQDKPVPAARKKSSLPTRLPPALRKTRLASKSASLTITSTDEEDVEAPTNPPPKMPKKYVEIADEEDEEMPMNVGPAPKMGTPYILVPPAPIAIAGNDAADPNVWRPGCGPCRHRGLACRQGFNIAGSPLTVCESCHRLKHRCGGNGSAIPATKGKKAAATTSRPPCSKSRRRPSPVHVSPETVDSAAPAAASTSGAPAPVVAAITAPVAAPAPITAPITATAPIPTPAAASTPDRPADASVVALIEALHSTVASLEAKLLPPPVPASPVLACLPVMISNLSGSSNNIAAAEDGAESAPGGIGEAEAESTSGVNAGASGNNMDLDVSEDLEAAAPSGDIAGLSGNSNNIAAAEDGAESAPGVIGEAEAESTSGVNAGASGNAMELDVPEDLESAAPSGDIAGLSGNTNDVVAEAEAAAESASIASSAHE